MKFYNRENELKDRISAGTKIFKAPEMRGINSLQRVASFFLPTNRYTVGISSTAFIIRLVFPILRLPVITVRREFSSKDRRCILFNSASSLFQYMMEIAGQRAFNLVIDEFQEFYNINNSIYSDIQNIWDRYRKETKMNLIVCGSIYSLMNKIFQNNKEPLFGRADIIIKLSPFSLPVLKEIMYDYYPTYTNDDLLALYTFTGGIPK